MAEVVASPGGPGPTANLETEGMDRQRTPMMFTVTKKNMSKTATTMPQPCSVPEAELKKLRAQRLAPEQVDHYVREVYPPPVAE